MIPGKAQIAIRITAGIWTIGTWSKMGGEFSTMANGMKVTIAALKLKRLIWNPVFVWFLHNHSELSGFFAEVFKSRPLSPLYICACYRPG